MIIRERDRYWSDPKLYELSNVTEARESITRAAFAKAGILDDALRIGLIELYSKVRTELIQPVPGAIELLQSLRNLGIRLALLTNGTSSGQRNKLKRFDFEIFFDFILISEEFGEGKPHPSVYQAALLALQVKPSESWIVGDNFEWDVSAPTALSIQAIWYNPRFQSTPNAQPKDYKVISSLSEITGFARCSSS